MKNRNLLLLPVLAILTLFAITGCPGPTNTGREDTVTVTFKSYEGVTPLEFAIPVNETLGSTRYASVQALQTRDGYDFKGWALSGDTDPVKVDASSKWSVDTDYNGLWAPTVEAGENITITYNLNSFPGSQPADYTAISGDPITASALPDLSAQDYVWLGWSLTKDGSLVKNDAVFNSDTILYAIYISPGSTPVEPPEPVELDMPYGLHPLRTAVPADFIRGADISNCLEIETAAGVHGAYRNFDGQVEDIMKILTDNGINWVRVRLWVDPTKATDHYAGDGNNNMAVTKVIAARAKAAGMKFLLNIHYSDYWADPSHQQIPYIWKDITPRQSLLDAVYDYTVSAIQELTEAGAEPDMVALGNEIRSGLLSQHADGSAGGTGYALSGWGDYSMALSNASKAVRKAAPHAKIMIHFDMGGASSILGTYGNFTKRIDTGAPATNTEVDYDVVGLSWYTIWSSHSTIDNLYSNIQAFKSRYGKEVVVCETGYMWDIGNWDSMGNYAGPTEEQTAVAALTNSNGFVSDSDVQFAYRSDGTTKYVPSNPENQCRVTRATMDAIVAAGGAGIIWWGADWIALPSGSGLKSNSEMATIFASSGNWDTNGQVLP
ncbi:MAG: glycosyl hydrolase 53 family protein, partial [Treponema sp.]|nr:glycosyl hydrolase 53 family protein [Treponema sp.]